MILLDRDDGSFFAVKVSRNEDTSPEIQQVVLWSEFRLPQI